MAEMKPWLMIPDGKPNGKEDVKIYMITIPKWVAVIILLLAKMSAKCMSRNFVKGADRKEVTTE